MEPCLIPAIAPLNVHHHFLAPTPYLDPSLQSSTVWADPTDAPEKSYSLRPSRVPVGNGPLFVIESTDRLKMTCKPFTGVAVRLFEKSKHHLDSILRRGTD